MPYNSVKFKKRTVFPQLVCGPSKIICPVTGLAVFERLQQLANKRVEVVRGGTKTAGFLRNVQFLEEDALFTINGVTFTFSEIQRMVLLDEAVSVITFNAVIQTVNPAITNSVRLIHIGPAYVEFISFNQDRKRRVIIPKSRVQDIQCIAGSFNGRPEPVTVVERLNALIGKEIGILVPPRGSRTASVTLLEVRSDSVTVRDEIGTDFELNFMETPVIFGISGNFAKALALVTVQSSKGGIDLTFNLNRLGLDFIEISNPEPPFPYFLIPLNPFITVTCAPHEH